MSDEYAANLAEVNAIMSELLDTLEFERLRETWLSNTTMDAEMRYNAYSITMPVPLGSREPVFVVKTHIGGGNREKYADAILKLQAHSRYLFDHDWDHDCTYAFFYFHLRSDPRIQRAYVDANDL